MPLGNIEISGGNSSHPSALPGSITTKNGTIIFDNFFNLNENLILSTVGSGGSGATVDLSNASFNQFFNMEIYSGSGAIIIGDMGTSVPIGSLTLSGTSLTFENIITGSRIIQASSVPIQLATQGTSTLNTAGTGSGANIDLNTVDGVLVNGLELAPALILNAGTAGVISVGNMGLNHPLGAVTISSAPNFAVPNITTAGGNIKINPTILLSQDAVLNTVFGSAGGSITLSSVSGSSDYTFTLNAGEDFIQVGGIGPVIGDVSMTGGAITLTTNILMSSSGADLIINNSGILSILSGTINVTSGNFEQIGTGETELSKNITAREISFAGPILLESNVAMTASSTSITLAAVSGDFDLTLTAITDISLTSIQSKDLQFNAITGFIAITGAAEFEDANFIAAGSVSIGSATGSSLTITGTAITVSSDVTVGTLTVNASSNVTIGGATTLTQNSSITSSGGSITLHEVISALNFTANAQTFIQTGSISSNNLTLDANTGSVSTSSLTILGTAQLTSGTSITVTGNLDSNSSVLNAGAFIEVTEDVTGGSSNMTAGTSITILGNAFLDSQLTLTASAGALSIGGAVEVPLANFFAGDGISVLGDLFQTEEATLHATSGDILLPQVLSLTSLDVTADNGSFSSGIMNAADVTLDISGSITINGTLSLNTLIIQNADGMTIAGKTVADEIELGDGSGTLSGNFVFEDLISIDVLTTTSQNYSVSIEKGGRIFSPTTFLNTGTVTLQGIPTSLIIDGELISNSIPTNVSGVIATTFGGMSFQSLNVFSEGASLTTQGADIDVAGALTLNGNTTFATLGGDLHFDSTITGSGGLTTSTSIGTVFFSQPIGPISYLTAVDVGRIETEGVTATGTINMGSPIILTASGENLFQTPGQIILGDIEGSTSGFQDLRVLGGTGGVKLGNVGQTIPLGNVLISRGDSATLKNIQTEGTVQVDIQTFLGATSVTFNTDGGSSLGADITLQQVDGASVGGQGLTLNAGLLGGVILAKNVGSLVAPASLDVEGASLAIYGSLMNIVGNQDYHPETIIYSAAAFFVTGGNITFYSTLDMNADLSSLVFSMGGGAFTALGPIDNTHMGNLSIFNSGSFSSHEITARTLRVTGGRSTITLNNSIELSGEGGIILDGGPIFLGGEIEAKHVFFRSSGAMSNISSPQAISIEGQDPFQLEYFNALGGNIGSPESPIEINMTNLSNLGAKRRADFIGTPFHSKFFLIPSNAPCIVTFNGVTIVDCSSELTPQSLFQNVPKNLLYVPGIYSPWSWDNLSNDWYFKESLWNLNENPRDLTLFYVPSQRKSKKVIVQ